jgi:metal-sulfur cluster biosynthetic enzyme
MINPDVAGALDGIVDPELGVGIVDLGLVYRATRDAAGIDVLLTTTSPSCPMSELLVAQVNDALHRSFPDSDVNVTLTWDPAWSPSRASDSVRQRLGWTKRPARSTSVVSTWPARILRRLTRH